MRESYCSFVSTPCQGNMSKLEQLQGWAWPFGQHNNKPRQDRGVLPTIIGVSVSLSRVFGVFAHLCTAVDRTLKVLLPFLAFDFPYLFLAWISPCCRSYIQPLPACNFEFRLIGVDRQSRKRKIEKMTAPRFESGICRVSNRISDSRHIAATPKGGRVGLKNTSWGKCGHFGKSQQKLSSPRLHNFSSLLCIHSLQSRSSFLWIW
jgi:hypothetical protein